ncbi:MAG: hypothetical protein AAF570_19740 [Bacteroidota bacterium]
MKTLCLFILLSLTFSHNTIFAQFTDLKSADEWIEAYYHDSIGMGTDMERWEDNLEKGYAEFREGLKKILVMPGAFEYAFEVATGKREAHLQLFSSFDLLNDPIGDFRVFSWVTYRDSETLVQFPGKEEGAPPIVQDLEEHWNDGHSLQWMHVTALHHLPAKEKDIYLMTGRCWFGGNHFSGAIAAYTLENQRLVPASVFHHKDKQQSFLLAPSHSIRFNEANRTFDLYEDNPLYDPESDEGEYKSTRMIWLGNHFRAK